MNLSTNDNKVLDLLADGKVRTAKQIAEALQWSETKNMNGLLNGLADRLMKRHSNRWLRCRKRHGQREGKIWWLQQRTEDRN